VYDPSGVHIELTFQGAPEAGAPPDMSVGRGYVAGSGLFEPGAYFWLGRTVILS
jgi:hypothetical protein